MEESQKPTYMQTMISQAEQIKKSLQRFESSEALIEKAQLTELSNKFKFYLIKYTKLIEEHRREKEAFNNIIPQVTQHVSIRSENERIQLLKMISLQTQKKVYQLSEAVKKIQHNKLNISNEVKNLHQVLLAQKKKYFQLNRKLQEHKNQQKSKFITTKIIKNQQEMMKIRKQKRIRDKINQSIPKIRFQKLLLKQNRQNLQIIKKTQQLDTLRSLILKEGNINEKNINKLFLQKKVFDLQTISASDTHLLQNSFELFKQIQNEALKKDAFMNLDSQIILSMIIKQNKIQQVLQLIQKEKKSIFYKKKLKIKNQ